MVLFLLCEVREQLDAVGEPPDSLLVADSDADSNSLVALELLVAAQTEPRSGGSVIACAMLAS